MTLCVAVINQKGGVGKTTTCAHIAAAWAERGLKTLAVDVDPQASLTRSFGYTPGDIPVTLAEVLISGAAIAQAILPDPIRDNLQLLPSRPALAGLETRLRNHDDKPHVLSRALDAVFSDFDAVVLDAPPTLNLLSINCLTAARWVLVPVTPGYLNAEGVTELVRMVEKSREGLHSNVDILGLLLTMLDRRNLFDRRFETQLRETFHSDVLSTVIRNNVRVREAGADFKLTWEYDDMAIGGHDYLDLAAELLTRVTMRDKKFNDTPPPEPAAPPLAVPESPVTGARHTAAPAAGPISAPASNRLRIVRPGRAHANRLPHQRRLTDSPSHETPSPSPTGSPSNTATDRPIRANRKKRTIDLKSLWAARCRPHMSASGE